MLTLLNQYIMFKGYLSYYIIKLTKDLNYYKFTCIYMFILWLIHLIYYNMH